MKAAIFDLDGTLVESLSGLAEALNRTRAEQGEAPNTLPEVRSFIGDGMRMLLRRSFPEERFPTETLEALSDSFQAHYAEVWKDGTEPYEGISEMLQELHGMGVKLGVLSNKPHGFTVEIVEELFGRELMPLIYGQREGVPKKPDPSALISLCEETGIAPEDVVYIGDSTVDLETAIGAQTKGIGVTWGYHDRDRLVPYKLPLAETVSALSQTLKEMV